MRTKHDSWIQIAVAATAAVSLAVFAVRHFFGN